MAKKSEVNRLSFTATIDDKYFSLAFSLNEDTVLCEKMCESV
jgi:hypothetical protein